MNSPLRSNHHCSFVHCQTLRSRRQKEIPEARRATNQLVQLYCRQNSGLRLRFLWVRNFRRSEVSQRSAFAFDADAIIPNHRSPTRSVTTSLLPKRIQSHQKAKSSQPHEKHKTHLLPKRIEPLHLANRPNNPIEISTFHQRCLSTSASSPSASFFFSLSR